MIGECAPCGRVFTSLTAFDAHQRWDYTQPPGQQLCCHDPGALLDGDGEPRFRPDSRGRWGSARPKPAEAWTRAPQSGEQPSPHPPVSPRAPRTPTGALSAPTEQETR